jgi:NAD+ synthase (glutamine-hydrolysing)
MIPTNQNELTLAIEVLKSRAKDRFKNLEVINNKKISSLNSYFEENDINSVVIGVSGGIDSSVVLALLDCCNYLKNIYAVNIVFDAYQKVYDEKYYHCLKHNFFGSSKVRFIDKDLSNSLSVFSSQLFYISETSDWLNGQVSYAMRYLAFFAIAQQTGSVTIGTTNLDEFGYSGWFGKNSDMMVDIQPIADLHKFQVKLFAEMLTLPEEIISRAPTGDLISGKTDEECFGVTYDELSYLTHLMTSTEMGGCGLTEKSLSPFMQEKFKKVIELHHTNLHKYKGQTFNPIFIK